MNKLKISLLLVCLLILPTLFFSCGSSKESPKPTVEQQETYLSPMALSLRDDLEELGREVSPNDTELIERYSLKRRGDTYWVRAILTLNPPYADGELEQYGVLAQSLQDDRATVLLSTREYLRLIDYRALKAIEISTKIQTNN